MTKFDGVKVFSATKARERSMLGDRLTEWIDDNPELKVVDTVITQSSDAEFHCLTFTVFYQNHMEGRAEMHGGMVGA